MEDIFMSMKIKVLVTIEDEEGKEIRIANSTFIKNLQKIRKISILF